MHNTDFRLQPLPLPASGSVRVTKVAVGRTVMTHSEGTPALSLMVDTRFQLVLVAMVTPNNGCRYVCAGICKFVLRIPVCLISFQIFAVSKTE